VLVAPATFLDGVQILWSGLQPTERAAVLLCRNLHLTPPVRLDGPVQQRQGIGFVVVDRGVATRPDGGDHLVLARIALAGRVLLDRADRHALVRDLVVLAPRGERGQEAAVGVRRVGRAWRRTSSKYRQSMPSQDCLISVSQRLKRRKRMPPPSKRCGLKLSEPLVMWPSLPRSAQPVVVPRSRARMVVVMVSVLVWVAV
jgi:hypothetical protein